MNKWHGDSDWVMVRRSDREPDRYWFGSQYGDTCGRYLDSAKVAHFRTRQKGEKQAASRGLRHLVAVRFVDAHAEWVERQQLLASPIGLQAALEAATGDIQERIVKMIHAAESELRSLRDPKVRDPWERRRRDLLALQGLLTATPRRVGHRPVPGSAVL